MGIGLWQLIIMSILFLLPIFIYRPVAEKAGFPGWWAVTMAIPVVNIAVVWAFAFMEWPVEREAGALEAPGGGARPEDEG